MPTGLSILHVEDEYREFLDLVSFTKTMIEDLLERKYGVLQIAHTRVIARAEDKRQTWIVYEICCDKHPDLCVRYIFVSSKTVPGELFQYLLDDRIFILDVLRPMEGQTILGISVHESMTSIKEYVRSASDVVLFTAHQGTGLDATSEPLPRKISKESGSELEDLISAAVIRSFGDD